MYTQILEVALGNHCTDGIGHTADAELQAGTVGNVLHNQLGHGLIHFGGCSAAGKLVDGRIVALDDAVNLRNMQAVVMSAQADRHIAVDFNVHFVRLAGSISQMACAGTEVEVAVIVHRRRHKHCNVQRVGAFPVVTRQFRVADGGVERISGIHSLALDAAHVPAVPGKVRAGILNLENFRHVAENTAAELDVIQTGHTLGQCCVKGYGGADTPAVVDPVAVLDLCGHGIGTHQLLCVNRLVIHKKQLLCLYAIFI